MSNQSENCYHDPNLVNLNEILKLTPYPSQKSDIYCLTKMRFFFQQKVKFDITKKCNLLPHDTEQATILESLCMYKEKPKLNDVFCYAFISSESVHLFEFYQLFKFG